MSDPDWWKSAVFYQIYPRSYMDTTGNGIGDLHGIIEKIPYLSNLGIDALWISPFFQSPMADFGYDVSDYRSVDPLFGNNQIFDDLLKCAHDHGLKIIVDMVLSHTSEEHPWFKESRSSGDNEKSDWYVWADAKPDGSPPNNWQSVFEGPAWTFDTRRGKYYLHNFLKQQPDLNFHNEAVQQQLLEECKFWLDKGVDGFRLDTANFYTHDKELRDNPPKTKDETPSNGTQFEKPYPYGMQRHVFDKSRPENLNFLKKLRSLMDQYPGTMTLGEIGDDDPYKLSVEYTEGNQHLHTAYNTHFMAGTDEGVLTKELIEDPINKFQALSKTAWPSWAFANHDVVRPVTRWGKNIKDKQAFSKLLIQILLTLRGTPFLYQGDELGLPEASIEFDDIQDPWGKALWPEWQGRDGCRTPIPWQKNGPYAGFSNTNQLTWLPISDTHTKHAVSEQEKESDSVLQFTKDFLLWRKNQPTIQLGDITFIETNNDNVLAYQRSLNDQTVQCLFNLSEDVQVFEDKKLSALEATFTNI